MKKFSLNALGVIGSIASIISLFSTNFIFKLIGIIFVIAYIVAITVFIIIRFFSINKIRNNLEISNQNKLQQLSDINRHIFNSLKNESAEINNKNSVDQNSFENTIVNCCTSINNYFNKYLDNSNSVCIKRIKTETILNDDVKNWDIVTFGRSLMSKKQRGEHDNVACKVEDNSDFELILTGESDYFASPNLINTAQKYKDNNTIFKNSRKNYLDYYHSAIVVPIRIKMSKISKKLKSCITYTVNEDSYHVLGFLCIDSMDEFAEDSTMFKSAVEQAIAFSDALYPLIESYLVSQLPESEPTA